MGRSTEKFSVSLLILVGIFILCSATVAWSQNQQIVTPNPPTLNAPASSAVSIDVNYSTNPADQRLTGLGLRLHFNAAQLAFVSLTNVLPDSLSTTGVPQPDTSNFDGDPNTDTFVNVLWFNLAGTWPSGTLPVRLYTANFTTAANFSTSTTINFSAASTAAGFTLVSQSAAVNFFVPQNPPTANAQTVMTPENTPVAITLTGTDPDGNPLTFAIVTNPTNGALSGTPPNVTYTPNTAFAGTDSFTFITNDGTQDSSAATVTINVTDVPVPIEVALGGQTSPDDVTVTGSEENVPVIQLQVDSGADTITINTVTVNFSDFTGDATAVTQLGVKAINDTNGNGIVDAGEPVLADQDVASEAGSITLNLVPPLVIPPDSTTNLLIALDITGAGGTGALLSPQTPMPSTRLAWLFILPPVIGMVLSSRRRRSSWLLISIFILALGCSVALTGCPDDDDGEEELAFAVGIPANGVVGQGAAFGPFSAPAEAITGPTITVTP